MVDNWQDANNLTIKKQHLWFIIVLLLVGYIALLFVFGNAAIFQSWTDKDSKRYISKNKEKLFSIEDVRIHKSLQILNLLPQCKSEQQSFVYIKTWCDTLSAVFRRFGLTRNLSVFLPVGTRWNIGYPEYPQPYMYPASKDGGKFQILTEHTMHNESLMDVMMVPGTVYFTSIREPFSHFLS